MLNAEKVNSWGCHKKMQRGYEIAVGYTDFQNPQDNCTPASDQHEVSTKSLTFPVPLVQGAGEMMV